MNFPKFLLKNDWYVESKILNQVTKELLFEKGRIFESETGIYDIIWGGWSETNQVGGRMQLSEKMMRDAQDADKGLMFEQVPEEIKEEVVMSVEEIPDSEENEIKNWRIQLDVKTTRAKLREVEKIINEMVKPIL
jgi:hypothetical protein